MKKIYDNPPEDSNGFKMSQGHNDMGRIGGGTAEQIAAHIVSLDRSKRQHLYSSEAMKWAGILALELLNLSHSNEQLKKIAANRHSVAYQALQSLQYHNRLRAEQLTEELIDKEITDQLATHKD